MSPTQTLERNNETGLTESTHSSSSSSAIRYNLDEQDDSPILLYRYHGGLQTTSQKKVCSWLDKGESPTLHYARPGGVLSAAWVGMTAAWTKKCHARDRQPVDNDTLPPQEQLNNTNDTRTTTNNHGEEGLRVTKKPIPRACSYVDIKRHDLYLPEEKREYANLPNYDSNLASIKVPSLAYWSRLLLGNYQELYIVSPESSPNSSLTGSQNCSARTSPTSTWSREDAADAEARMGAGEDKSHE